jgi:hypothetical protein
VVIVHLHNDFGLGRLKQHVQIRAKTTPRPVENLDIRAKIVSQVFHVLGGHANVVTVVAHKDLQIAASVLQMIVQSLHSAVQDLLPVERGNEYR